MDYSNLLKKAILISVKELDKSTKSEEYKIGFKRALIFILDSLEEIDKKLIK